MRRIRRLLRILFLALTGIAGPAVSSRGELVLNEVLYDPEGPDEAREFVELWNPDEAPRTLEGVVLELGDGARPGSWTALFAGSDRDTVPAGGALCVAGARLVTAIQNGPDAVRLRRGGATLDLLGWGALEAPEHYEGAPAADAPSGQSLARRADGVDSGSNRDDWEAAILPTPGRPNRPDVWIAFAPGRTRLEPPIPWPGERFSVLSTVRNLGRSAVDASAWGIEIDLLIDSSPGTWLPGNRYAGAAVAPGESLAIAPTGEAPPRGPFQIRARLVGREGVAIADTAVAASRSGPGPAVVNEIAFHDGGAGEWIEILALEPIPDVAALSIADASGRPRSLNPAGAPESLGPGERLVVAESPASLRARLGPGAPPVAGVAGGWPSLNDAEGPAGFADVAWLLGPGGVPWDAVPYRAAYAERGRSLERLAADLPSAAAGSWGESLDPSGGTPGRENSLRAPPPGGGEARELLTAGARVLPRRGGAPVAPVIFRLTARARDRTLRVRVHDLLGRVRRTLIDGQRFSGGGAFLWDGRDDEARPVPEGIYVIRAEAEGGAGVPPAASSLPLTVLDREAR